MRPPSSILPPNPALGWEMRGNFKILEKPIGAICPRRPNLSAWAGCFFTMEAVRFVRAPSGG
jgi:hypothetical protein